MKECSKKAYDSYALAQDAANAIKARSKTSHHKDGKRRPHAPSTVYKCQTCEKWHLSSKSKKTINYVKKSFRNN